MDIVATYALGSAAMAFDRDNLAVDRVELLGVYYEHLRVYVEDLRRNADGADWTSTKARCCR